MEPKNILVKKEGAVGVVTLNRPKALNALNAELLEELAAALEEFDADPAIRAIVVRDVYELIEKVVDRCHDTGNVVMQIVLKNS